MNSPDVYNSESNYILNKPVGKNIPLYVGEFEKGEINKPYWITDILQFKLIFGRALDWNFNHWYQVYNYLKYSSGIWVCRTAGEFTTFSSNSGNVASSPGEWGNLLRIEIYTGIEITKEIKSLYDNNIEKKYIIFIYRNNKLVEKWNIDSISEFNSSYFSEISLESGIFELSGGLTEPATKCDYKSTLEIFTKEDYEIDIVISPEDYNDVFIDFAESRKDCVAFLGLPRKFFELLVVNGKVLTTEDGKIIYLPLLDIFGNYKKNLLEIKKYIEGLRKSEYAFLVIGFKVLEDGFTNKKKIINCIGDIAGLKVKSSIKNPWSLGCGVEKGTLIEYVSAPLKLDKSLKDEFYKIGANTIESGTLLSQKLLLDRKSKIDRLHSRFILNTIERECEKLVRKYLFNLNDRTYRGILATELKRLLDSMISEDGMQTAKIYVTKGNLENSVIINITLKLSYVIDFIIININNIGTKMVTEIL